MNPPPPAVHIHYLRPPDDRTVFTQCLLVDREDVKVTLARDVRFESPVRVHGRPVLEDGADAVWFTFPGRWHDIGRFHLADDTFTGIYVNILTPPVFEERGRSWRTTDLFLDLWLSPQGQLSVLDRDQFEEAVREGWIEPDTAERARREVRRLREVHRRGRWPPAVVDAWPLERARRRAED